MVLIWVILETFKDSPRLVFIDEEFGDLIGVSDDKELPRNITQKKKSDILQQAADFHSQTNVVGLNISSIIIWSIVNQTGKHGFSCGSVVNNLKDRKLFSDQTNSNHFDPILTRREWNCSTVQNLTCLNYLIKFGATRTFITACSRHITCTFQRESTIYTLSRLYWENFYFTQR